MLRIRLRKSFYEIIICEFSCQSRSMLILGWKRGSHIWVEQFMLERTLENTGIVMLSWHRSALGGGSGCWLLAARLGVLARN